MSNVNYVAVSRQSALKTELAAIANNVANADTAGFRRESAIFTEYVQALAESPSVSQTRIGGRQIDFAPGKQLATGAPFDFSIEGEGFFTVLTPNGPRLTRAGNFSLSPEGVLVTVDGHPVSGEGGAPIVADPTLGSINVAPDGVISAGGAAIGRLEIVAASPLTLEREGSTLFRSSEPTTPIAEPRVRQGFLEQSNVEPVIEISRLIEVQRAFELNQQILDQDHERQRRTIEAVGGR